MNQLLLGASIPFLIATVMYLLRGRRASIVMLAIVPISMMVSALWAVLPDIPRLLGYNRIYMRLASDPICDIFWWHYTIDQREVDSPWFAVGLVVALILLLLAILRELGIAENTNLAGGSGT